MRIRLVGLVLPALWLTACKGPAADLDGRARGGGEGGHLPGYEDAGPDAAAGADSPEDSPEESGTGEAPWIRGQLSARYRGRWRPGEDDHDLTATLSLDAGDADRDRWTYHFLGSGFADLDGHSAPSEALFGLEDTYQSAVQGRVYDAYADVHGAGLVERVRLGRQLDHDTPALAWFDGVSLVADAGGDHRLGGGLYGGVPVHAYESSPEGDLLGGLWAEARPWKEGRVRLDWMHIEDDYLARDHEEDLAGVSLWQNLGGAVRLEGGYTMLDGDDRDVRAAATVMTPGGDLVVRAFFYKLLETQRSQAIETDPFYDSLQELFPYEQARLLVSGNLGEVAVLQGGIDLRRVEDDGDVGQFNRDFDRTFVNATVLEGLPLDLEATLSWDLYDSDDTDTRVLGADLTRPFGEETEASIGTYYGLFKYDLLLNQEREDVRTWYLRLRKRLDERTRLDLSYEYEDDDLDDYQTLRVGTTWRF